MKVRAVLPGLATAIAMAMAAVANVHAANAERIAQVHRIGVIAAIGDRVEIAQFGFTPSDSKDGYLPVEPWRLDDLAVRDAAAMLAGRFQIVPTTYDKARFLATDPGPPNANPPLGPLIQALPASDVDAYLVIRKAIWSPLNTWALDGLAVQKSRILFGVRPAVYVTLEADLVQAGTGKTLISKHLGVPSMAQEDRGDWADTPAGMTTAQIEKLHSRIAELVQKEIARTLASMGLASP